MMTAAPIFHIGFKDWDTGLTGEKLIKKDLVTNIILDILFGSSSTFYNDLYEEGLINTNFGGYYTGKESYGHSLIVGESKEPKKVYEKLIQLIQKPAETLLLEEDFNRIKNKTIGEFLMGLNSIEFIGNNFVDLYFTDFLLIDYLSLLEKVEYKDIIQGLTTILQKKM